VVAAGALVRATDIAAESSADFALKDIAYLPPIVAPGKIICVEVDTKSQPSYQLRSADSLVGHQQALTRPADAVLEGSSALALVIGRQARHVPESEALDCLAGVTLANDGRVPIAGDGALPRLSPRSGSMGPCLVTIDELPDIERLAVAAAVNGEPAGQLDAAALTLPRLLCSLSQATVLRGGDVVMVGTSGVPRPSLDFGDQLSLSAEPLGTLSNDVRAETVGAQPER
jgi:2-keto-4-pentenoate hydratase/2-oxohepta-3-ene-1,7-dioic acid hydratase in catechol pathway